MKDGPDDIDDGGGSDEENSAAGVAVGALGKAMLGGDEEGDQEADEEDEEEDKGGMNERDGKVFIEQVPVHVLQVLTSS